VRHSCPWAVASYFLRLCPRYEPLAPLYYSTPPPFHSVVLRTPVLTTISSPRTSRNYLPIAQCNDFGMKPSFLFHLDVVTLAMCLPSRIPLLLSPSFTFFCIVKIWLHQPSILPKAQDFCWSLSDRSLPARTPQSMLFLTLLPAPPHQTLFRWLPDKPCSDIQIIRVYLLVYFPHSTDVPHPLPCVGSFATFDPSCPCFTQLPTCFRAGC